MARDLAENAAPVSMALTKQLLWRQLAVDDPREAKEQEDALFDWIGKQPDAHEGVTSFLEKRAPKFAMRPFLDWPE
jgi:enoyl-CoA hydratase/carnithine racemase